MNDSERAELIVTGRAQFAQDVSVGGLLVAKVLRSPYPSARVIAIDVEAALALEGVVDVLTPWNSRPMRSERQVVTDRPRYVGDAVAAVAATHAHIAERAIRALSVKWEELPSVQGVAVSTQENVLVDPRGNVATLKGPAHYPQATVAVDRGSVDDCFQGDVTTISGRYETGYQVHGHIEPHCTTAAWSPDRARLMMWTATQNPHSRRTAVAQMLGLEAEAIEIESLFVGGGYGGKESADANEAVYIDAIAIELSFRTGRAVRYRASHRENLTCFSVRGPMTIEIRSAVRPDGKIEALDVFIAQDSGGYADAGPRTVLTAASVLESSYRVANFRLRGYAFLTNSPVAGKVWGYGAPEITFAIEQHIEQIASELRLSASTVRLRNVTRPGDPLPGKPGELGLKRHRARGIEVLDELERMTGGPASAALRITTGDKLAGSGTRCSVESTGGDSSEAVIEITPSGHVQLSLGIGQMGTGSVRAIAMLVGEVLGIDHEKVGVEWGSTRMPWDWGGAASRAIHCVGQAAMNAAYDVLDQLDGLLRFPPNRNGSQPALAGEGSRSKRGRDLRGLDLRELAGLAHRRGWNRPSGGPWYGGRAGYRVEEGQRVLGRKVLLHPATRRLVEGSPSRMIGVGYADRNPLDAPWGAQRAAVTINPRSGEVTVDHATSVFDVRRLVDPIGATLQVGGGALFAHGFALTERVVYDRKLGFLLASDFRDIGVATFKTTVPLRSSFLEDKPHETGTIPFGLGESSVQLGAAVAAAVGNAIGSVVHRLPIHAEEIAILFKEKPFA